MDKAHTHTHEHTVWKWRKLKEEKQKHTYAKNPIKIVECHSPATLFFPSTEGKCPIVRLE